VNKVKIFALVTLFLLFACGRAGGEVGVVSAPSTPQPILHIPTPEPTPTSTPTPDPSSEWERVFFPLLPELRKIPGNENARVDWESGVLARGKGFLAVQYPIGGLMRIPIAMGQYQEEKIGPWLVRSIRLPPEGRIKVGCTVNYPGTRRCEVVEEGGVTYFIIEEDHLDFFFIIEANGVIIVPRWAGPVPPGVSPDLYEKARPLP
jgi:hypothetical protein